MTGLLKVALLGFLLLLLTLSIGCLQPQGRETIEYGFLEGAVDIGPICPVMKDPPDPNCLLTPEILKAWPIEIYSIEDNIKVKDLTYKNGGPDYSMILPSGRYVIKLKDGQRIGGNNIITEFIIEPGKTTFMDISIDTGIR